MIRDHEIKALLPGRYLTEDAHRGAGRFLVRTTKKGTVIFYYRYTKTNGKRDSVHLGYYDPKGIRGLTLVEARNKALQLSLRHQSEDQSVRSRATCDSVLVQQQAK